MYWFIIASARFTYKLDRPLAKVYNIFNTVIGLSHLCCHNILDTVLSKQPFSDFRYTVALHFRILQNFKHPSSSSPLLKLIKHTSIFLQSWWWRIGRGLTSRIAHGLSLSKFGTDYCPLHVTWWRVLQELTDTCLFQHNLIIFTECIGISVERHVDRDRCLFNILLGVELLVFNSD